jgi:hypothetical protein
MDNEILKIDETIRFKAKKGFTVHEFHRLGKEEEFLSETVEYFKYDTRKKAKGKSSWILLKDLQGWIDMLNGMDYEQF